MFEKYTLSQRLYFNMLELFEQRNKILMQKYQGHFVEDVLRHAQAPSTNYNIVKESKILFFKQQKNITASSLRDYQKDAYPARQPDYSEEFFYFGYPEGNFLKQICVVLMLWQIKGRFPVRFQEIESLQDHDETAYFVQSSLSQQTTLVNQIFKEIETVENDNCSPRVLQKFILDFLCSIEPRGFLTMLGIRKTVGSQDALLLPERADLEYMYNRLNKPLPKEEFVNNPNPSVLTVGARALMKHVGRKKVEHQQCYWVSKKDNLQDLSERDKNARADNILGRIISTVQWINVHTLSSSNPVFILELRDTNGYGARWEIDNQFRGLVEPQLKYK